MRGKQVSIFVQMLFTYLPCAIVVSHWMPCAARGGCLDQRLFRLANRSRVSAYQLDPCARVSRPRSSALPTVVGRCGSLAAAQYARVAVAPVRCRAPVTMLGLIAFVLVRVQLWCLDAI